ncbi:branched-chain amino acid ABC transporter permease [Herbaspirillum sp. RTI4]|uniref:branched-chain amino acid ABC transporter permease n=1 Tax=Herbaspirillum sp. RTI4 TaxID=3048640 RepID=UPI002AB5425E|nr:branched-chain amino acid ABC transporter permease [Herbaspirillum sp. RTI4]MDY7579274.1 branched-chain amino acid ABC transporter permease [Herbaspirillum sp. RTI4]MEA9982773.1 branched-chain amino acid ABC transporter permease [Herbaspirillum sp. RTI4]
MDFSIFTILTQDGITSGAIYALVSLALVLVFSVTRIIFLPQGEFVSFGALTLVALQAGTIPGTVWLLAAMAVLTTALDLAAALRLGGTRSIPTMLLQKLLLPLAIVALVCWAAPRHWPLLVQAALAIAVVTPMGPMIYRLAYQRLANAKVLILLIISVGVHFMMTGMGLLFFGPEGSRVTPYLDVSFAVGPMQISGQSIVILSVSLLLILTLALFFSYTLYGKALKATAMNRVGARLMGISTTMAGKLSLLFAAFIGSLSGILIVPTTAIYYDSGFLIGLKGFVGAILGGLLSYPLAAVGALVVGLLESFSSFWASEYKEVIVFTIIIPILLWRSMNSPHQGGDE